MGYIAAVVLTRGTIEIDDFQAEHFSDPALLLLAQRLEMSVGEEQDPNAMAPQTVEVVLNDGTRYARQMEQIYGSPQLPLSREQQLRKFRRCCTLAQSPLPQSQVEALIAQVDRLDTLADVRSLVDLTYEDN